MFDAENCCILLIMTHEHNHCWYILRNSRPVSGAQQSEKFSHGNWREKQTEGEESQKRCQQINQINLVHLNDSVITQIHILDILIITAMPCHFNYVIHAHQWFNDAFGRWRDAWYSGVQVAPYWLVSEFAWHFVFIGCGWSISIVPFDRIPFSCVRDVHSRAQKLNSFVFGRGNISFVIAHKLHI